MSRKTNVETVPGDLQKAQLWKPPRTGNFRIFAPPVDASGTGSSVAAVNAQEAFHTARLLPPGCVSAGWRGNDAGISTNDCRSLLTAHCCSGLGLTISIVSAPAPKVRAQLLASFARSSRHARAPGPRGHAGAARGRKRGWRALLRRGAADRADDRARSSRARWVSAVTIEVAVASERLQALTWIAPPGNAYDTGQPPLHALAAHIRLCAGPSGRNDDYVFRLEPALAELGETDPFVSELSALLRN